MGSTVSELAVRAIIAALILHPLFAVAVMRDVPPTAYCGQNTLLNATKCLPCPIGSGNPTNNSLGYCTCNIDHGFDAGSVIDTPCTCAGDRYYAPAAARPTIQFYPSGQNVTVPRRFLKIPEFGSYVLQPTGIRGLLNQITVAAWFREDPRTKEYVQTNNLFFYILQGYYLQLWENIYGKIVDLGDFLVRINVGSCYPYVNALKDRACTKGVWHFHYFMWDGYTGQTLYLIDGVPFNNYTSSTQIGSINERIANGYPQLMPLVIGAQYYSGSSAYPDRFFSGDVQGIRIWNANVPFSSQLAEEQLSPSFLNSLIFNFPFNQTDGTIVYEATEGKNGLIKTDLAANIKLPYWDNSEGVAFCLPCGTGALRSLSNPSECVCSGRYQGVWQAPNATGFNGCTCAIGYTGPSCSSCAPLYTMVAGGVCILECDCSGHGSCNEAGLCDCDEGWTGTHCNYCASGQNVCINLYTPYNFGN